MNKLIYLLTFVVMLACNTAQKAQPAQSAQTLPNPAKPPAPFVTWDKKTVDLGHVKKGEKRSLFFELTNTSGEEIQIDLVDACECTRVEYPRGPISPGGKGRLDVTFDSSEKDHGETIGINVVFRNNDAAGNPRIEVVEYRFELDK
jgi:peptidoglycan-associated lipoprotein